jgi:hypothetical protein
MANPVNRIDYAISLGIEERDGLWKIRYVNALESASVQSAYLPIDPTDSRVGTKIDGIFVAEPGPRLVKVLGWLYERIEKYPYYWPWEGTYVDKFGYDFEVTKTNDKTTDVEITSVAYDIVASKIEVKTPDPQDKTIEVEEILEPGGAYVKFTVTLNQPSPVSQITVSPFAPYPLEIVSIQYEEDIETFHPKKELILKDKKTSSSQSMTFSFSPITAKRFTIIMRQKNYTKNTYLVRGKEVENKELWDKISAREVDVTLNLTDNLETVEEKDITKWTGWDIYLQAQKKYYEDLAQWKRDLAEYNYYQAKLQEKRQAEATYNKQMSHYRSEYKKATERYNNAYKAWQGRVAADKKAQSAYEKELKLYNKELAALRDWQKRWG